MSTIVKVVGTVWQNFNGALCAIFIGDNETRIAVPAAAFSFLSGEARRRIAESGVTTDPVGLPPPWSAVRFIAIQTVNVGTTEDRKVGVIFDRGLESEFALSFPIDHARELGEHLMAEAERISKKAPSIN